jgi:hypothetical protein
VRIDLRRATSLWPQQFLHRADVVASFEQVRRETVAQRVATRRLSDVGRDARRTSSPAASPSRRCASACSGRPPGRSTAASAGNRNCHACFRAQRRILPRQACRAVALRRILLHDRAHLRPEFAERCTSKRRLQPAGNIVRGPCPLRGLGW